MIRINDETYGLSEGIRFDYSTENIHIYSDNSVYLFSNRIIDLFVDLADQTLIKEYNNELIHAILKMVDKKIIKIINPSKVREYDMSNQIIKSFNKVSYMPKTMLTDLIKHRNDISNQCINRLLNHNSDQSLVEQKKQINLIYIIFSYNCNMNCTYCFQSKIEPNGPQLSIENLVGILDKYNINDETTLVFYGGEPLLKENKKKIQTIMGLYKENKFRIITNGVNITKYMDLFAECSNNKLKITTTLDGPESIHNRRRKYNNAFSNIIAGIDRLMNLGIEVTVRINVDDDNINYIEELVAYLDERYYRYKLLNILIHKVEHKYSTKSSITLADLYRLSTQIKTNLPVRYGDNVLDRLINPGLYFFSPNITSIFSCNYLNQITISPSGNLYHCNEGTELDFMRIEDSENIIDISKKFKIETCEKCTYFEICKGGCLLQRYINNTYLNRNCSKKNEYIELYRLIERR